MPNPQRRYGANPETGAFEWPEFYCHSIQINNIATGSGTAFSPYEVKLDSDRPFQFMKTMYFVGNGSSGGPYDIDVFVKYRDESKYLTKRATLLRNLAGRSLPVDNSGARDFRPFIWPKAYRSSPSSVFTVEASSASALYTPNVYISFLGAKINQGVAPWKVPGLKKIPYVYPIPANLTTQPEGQVQLAANQSITQPILIDKNCDFLTQALVGSASGEALISITEGGRDKVWFNQAAHFWNIVGNGCYPNVLPSMKLSPGGSTVNVTIQDLSGATNNITLALVGMKVFGLSADSIQEYQAQTGG
jgi:hypothetical protein